MATKMHVCYIMFDENSETSNRCWSLKFKQSDHQFLHQSNVFHHINNILSKSDDGDSEESFNISVQSGYEAISQVTTKQHTFCVMFYLMLLKFIYAFLLNHCIL